MVLHRKLTISVYLCSLCPYIHNDETLCAKHETDSHGKSVTIDDEGEEEVNEVEGRERGVDEDCDGIVRSRPDNENLTEMTADLDNDDTLSEEEQDISLDTMSSFATEPFPPTETIDDEVEDTTEATHEEEDTTEATYEEEDTTEATYEEADTTEATMTDQLADQLIGVGEDFQTAAIEVDVKLATVTRPISVDAERSPSAKPPSSKSCQICDLRLASNWHRRRHEAQVHDIGTMVNAFHCDHCAKTFGAKWNLRRHIAHTHATEAPKGEGTRQDCKICGKTMRTSYNLSRHMLAMHGETTPKPTARITKAKSVVKCQFCPKSFLLQHYLSKHIRSIHSQTKPLTCDKCERQFTVTESTMRIHVEGCAGTMGGRGGGGK